MNEKAKQPNNRHLYVTGEYWDLLEKCAVKKTRLEGRVISASETVRAAIALYAAHLRVGPIPKPAKGGRR